jgi:hypothetical protein
VQRLVNNGSFFENQPTGTITLISPNAVAHLIPMEEIAGTSHTAFGIFATPFDNAFQADTVVFQRNGYPETFPITSSPRIVGPPPISQHEFGTFLGGQTHAAVFNFSNGSCPPEEWAGTFETLHTFDPDNDGVADVDQALAQSTGIDTALIQYGSNQVSFGTTWVDPYRFELVGSGDDYTEFYSFTNADVNSGTYTHTSGDSDECTWDFTITGGLTNMVTEVNDELDALAAAAVTTSSPPETTTPGTTEAPATTPDDQGSGAAATTSTVTAASDDDGGGKGGLVFIIIGILLVIAALTYWWWRTFMMPAPWQHPCWPQYVAWQ